MGCIKIRSENVSTVALFWAMWKLSFTFPPRILLSRTNKKFLGANKTRCHFWRHVETHFLSEIWSLSRFTPPPPFRISSSKIKKENFLSKAKFDVSFLSDLKVDPLLKSEEISFTPSLKSGHSLGSHHPLRDLVIEKGRRTSFRTIMSQISFLKGLILFFNLKVNLLLKKEGILFHFFTQVWSTFRLTPSRYRTVFRASKNYK